MNDLLNVSFPYFPLTPLLFFLYLHFLDLYGSSEISRIGKRMNLFRPLFDFPFLHFFLWSKGQFFYDDADLELGSNFSCHDSYFTICFFDLYESWQIQRNEKKNKTCRPLLDFFIFHCFYCSNSLILVAMIATLPFF